MRTARAGAQEFWGETKRRKDSAVDTVSHSCYLAYQANVGRENSENQTALAGFRVSW